MNTRYRTWIGCFIAIASMGAALELRYLLIDDTNEDTTFFAAVAISAMIGGFWPGLLAFVLSAAITVADYPLLYHDSQHPLWTMGFFAAESILISGVCGLLHRSQRRAKEHATEASDLRDRMISISEAEQRRIGQDLHDGLGQQLTGIAFLSESLAKRLSRRDAPEAEEARRIVSMVSQTVGWTRDIARGLTPVAMEADDLVSALRHLAETASGLFDIRCQVIVQAESPRVPQEAAIHLYRIAQEAISNAVKHGHASEVCVEFRSGRGTELCIRDNGIGVDGKVKATNGLGLEIMRHRARLIGASLQLSKASGGGTLVRCRIPAGGGGTEL